MTSLLKQKHAYLRTYTFFFLDLHTCKTTHFLLATKNSIHLRISLTGQAQLSLWNNVSLLEKPNKIFYYNYY